MCVKCEGSPSLALTLALTILLLVQFLMGAVDGMKLDPVFG